VSKAAAWADEGTVEVASDGRASAKITDVGFRPIGHNETTIRKNLTDRPG
jgi:hypothetical protein